MDKNVIPSGYRLVKDERVAGYTPPSGWRLEPVSGRKRMETSTQAGLPKRERVATLENLNRFNAQIRAVEAAGAAGVGRFVRYSTASRAPMLLVEKFGEDRRWAYIPSHGGYVRLAEKEMGPQVPLLAFMPGDFIGCVARGWVPGFASVKHGGFETPRIRVCLPSKEELEAGVGMEFKRTAAAAGAGLVKKRTDALKMMAGAPQEDVAVLAAWLETASEAEVDEWIKENGGAK